MILPPLPTYLSGTANTHAPLLGTPHLAGWPRPYYTTLRPSLAIRPATVALIPGTRTHTVPILEGLPIPYPFWRIYPYRTLPILEGLPIPYPLWRDYPYRTQFGGLTHTVPIPKELPVPYPTHTGGTYPYTTFTGHATLGWQAAPILHDASAFPSPTAYYPYAYTGNTHPYRTVLEELPIPYPFWRITVPYPF
jgi:hypothetical protein